MSGELTFAIAVHGVFIDATVAYDEADPSDWEITSLKTTEDIYPLVVADKGLYDRIDGEVANYMDEWRMTRGVDEDYGAYLEAGLDRPD